MGQNHELNSAEKTGNSPTNNGKDSSERSRLIDTLDVTAKLIGAGAIVATAVIANTFQSNITTTSLQSQREQAESALRANMFHDLIGPIVGSEKSSDDIPVNREGVLVQLLALNFHEHFELKPLMWHLDNRLAHEGIVGMNQTQRENEREMLRAAARRVIQRQVAMLTTSEVGLLKEQQACTYEFMIMERQPQQEKSQRITQPCSSLPVTRFFGDLITIKSPNGIYTLTFKISDPDWENQTFKVSTTIADNYVKKLPGSAQATSEATENKSKTYLRSSDFLLTWFDFPLSDNTLLADGTRFSLFLDYIPIPSGKKAAYFRLLWFPQDFFSPQERPTNYHKIGITLWGH
ncbi:hypothetical protein [Burkholderia ubonensis]|uniref:hypothetical protein n=1 Tax=Burkholderia ubonensis TaxID=101571 RepID=UPI000B026E7D|nr:hypothetical protein [Burkholderia ubonensis]